MVFPLHDENPLAHIPKATIALILLNLLAWALLQGFGRYPLMGASLCEYAWIPGAALGALPTGSGIPVSIDQVCVVDGSHGFGSVITSMFMHGGWFHLIGNMWFLWVFGDNVEDAMGPVRFTLFYLLCGSAAAMAQTAADPASAVPMVGASGAIGGVMGAYALLYPRARIIVLVVVFTVSVPAFIMLGYWVLLQVLGSLQGAAAGGVAFWAHLGGFAAGALLVFLFRNNELHKEHLAQPRRRSARYRFMA